MTLSPAETARKVADVVDYKNERFDMEFFEEERECGTVACIAGHIALLHGDRFNGCMPTWENEGGKWVFRQGFRLGLTQMAAQRLFYQPNLGSWLGGNAPSNDRRYGLVLRQLEKELADRDRGDLIDIYELDQIITEALA